MDLFKSEENALKIVVNAYKNYCKYFANRTYLFVYYNGQTKQYEFSEITFLKSNYKHLCGISDDPRDIAQYTKRGISKKVVNGKEFSRLIEINRLGSRHIIVKADNTTWQKLNIINNLFRLTDRNTLYYVPQNYSDGLKCNAMIGLKDGNITLALIKTGKQFTPLSTLDYNLNYEKSKYASANNLFEVYLVAYKKAYSKEKYKMENITLNNFQENFPVSISALFDK